MTDTAEAAALPEQVRENLEAFRRWAPHLYGRLAAVGATNSRLVADAEGRIDIVFRGRKFYSGDAEDYARRQLEDFLAKPSRHPINEPDPEVLEGACGDLCTAMLGRFADAGITYDPDHQPVESHVLAIFGVGLGLHIAPLIAHSRARVVILVETNLEFLYHSLFVADWAGLWREAEAAGRKFVILLETDSLSISTKVRNALQANNPALLDGIYLYRHYPSAILDQALLRIGEEISLTIAGLGFFEDELIMTENGVGNLARGPVKILSEYQPRRSYPLFIVGSGPSVEQELDFIAAHADRAILVTLGTALRVALRRGIQPDFHVELENGIGNYALIEPVAEEHDLSDITLIASLTVQPVSVALFGDAILFFREQVTSTKLFCGSLKVLKPAGPTVANSALIAAIRMGFREVYLFGVDMGTKVEGRFHAAGSVYDLGFRADPTIASRTFPGNFGGTATGESIYNWSRKVLEGVIQHFHNLTVYNCSDGVRIEGAIPKLSETIAFDHGPIDRARFRGELNAMLSPFPLERVRDTWSALDWRATTGSLFARIDRALAEAEQSPAGNMDWLHEVYDALRAANGREEALAVYLRGTMTLSLGCINWYHRRIAEAPARERFRLIALEETRAMVAGLKTRLAELFETVDRKIGEA